MQQLLTNPAAANQSHRQSLEALVQAYPACSIFRLLLAKSMQNAETDVSEKAIQAAAVHAANREILFRLIHQPELIVAPKPDRFYGFAEADLVEEVENIVFNWEDLPEETAFAATYPVEVINTAPVEKNQEESNFSAENISPKELTDDAYIEPKPAEIEDAEAVFVEDIPSAENSDTSFTDQISAENTEEIIADIPSAVNPNAAFTGETLEEAMAAENDFRVEDVSRTFVNEPEEELVFPEQTILTSEETFHQTQKPVAQEIDEDVYDEITAIEDIDFKSIKEVLLEIHPPEPIIIKPEVQPEPNTDFVSEPEVTAKPEEKLFSAHDDAEKAMLSNIASTDYFSFNHRFGQNQTSDLETEFSESSDYQIENTLLETDQQENSADTVSKYHDDKMPYTFMWWLDKTRKEYAGTYQPYAKIVQKNEDLSVGPELHQQYIESIFHTKAPLKVPENLLPPLEELPVKKKEKQLIERFIIEEPHIHPPSMDKLDTENKARKSSEDGDILVTETLAKVYLDQMLYHKALDTYKKLMLKFPEKSVYFAAQLTEIEKKIN